MPSSTCLLHLRYHTIPLRQTITNFAMLVLRCMSSYDSDQRSIFRRILHSIRYTRQTARSTRKKKIPRAARRRRTASTNSTLFLISEYSKKRSFSLNFKFAPPITADRSENLHTASTAADHKTYQISAQSVLILPLNDHLDFLLFSLKGNDQNFRKFRRVRNHLYR